MSLIADTFGPERASFYYNTEESQFTAIGRAIVIFRHENTHYLQDDDETYPVKYNHYYLTVDKDPSRPHVVSKAMLHGAVWLRQSCHSYDLQDRLYWIDPHDTDGIPKDSPWEDEFVMKTLLGRCSARQTVHFDEFPAVTFSPEAESDTLSGFHLERLRQALIYEARNRTRTFNGSLAQQQAVQPSINGLTGVPLSTVKGRLDELVYQGEASLGGSVNGEQSNRILFPLFRPGVLDAIWRLADKDMLQSAFKIVGKAVTQVDKSEKKQLAWKIFFCVYDKAKARFHWVSEGKVHAASQFRHSLYAFHVLGMKRADQVPSNIGVSFVYGLSDSVMTELTQKICHQSIKARYDTRWYDDDASERDLTLSDEDEDEGQRNEESRDVRDEEGLEPSGDDGDGLDNGITHEDERSIAPDEGSQELAGGETAQGQASESRGVASVAVETGKGECVPVLKTQGEQVCGESEGVEAVNQSLSNDGVNGEQVDVMGDGVVRGLGCALPGASGEKREGGFAGVSAGGHDSGAQQTHEAEIDSVQHGEGALGFDGEQKISETSEQDKKGNTGGVVGCGEKEDSSIAQVDDTTVIVEINVTSKGRLQSPAPTQTNNSDTRSSETEGSQHTSLIADVAAAPEPAETTTKSLPISDSPILGNKAVQMVSDPLQINQPHKRPHSSSSVGRAVKRAKSGDTGGQEDVMTAQGLVPGGDGELPVFALNVDVQERVTGMNGGLGVESGEKHHETEDQGSASEKKDLEGEQGVKLTPSVTGDITSDVPGPALPPTETFNDSVVAFVDAINAEAATPLPPNQTASLLAGRAQRRSITPPRASLEREYMKAGFYSGGCSTRSQTVRGASSRGVGSSTSIVRPSASTRGGKRGGGKRKTASKATVLTVPGEYGPQEFHFDKSVASDLEDAEEEDAEGETDDDGF